MLTIHVFRYRAFFVSVASIGESARQFAVIMPHCAAEALAFYEHAITIRAEVQQIWRREISSASILFIFTRYMILLDRILAIVGLWQLHYIHVRCRLVRTSKILISAHRRESSLCRDLVSDATH